MSNISAGQCQPSSGTVENAQITYAREVNIIIDPAPVCFVFPILLPLFLGFVCFFFFFVESSVESSGSF